MWKWRMSKSSAHRGAAIQAGWHAFHQRRDLRDSHGPSRCDAARDGLSSNDAPRASKAPFAIATSWRLSVVRWSQLRGPDDALDQSPPAGWCRELGPDGFEKQHPAPPLAPLYLSAWTAATVTAAIVIRLGAARSLCSHGTSLGDSEGVGLLSAQSAEGSLPRGKCSIATINPRTR